MLYRILVLYLCCMSFSYAESPKHINISLASVENRDGQQYYCVSLLGDTADATCYLLTNSAPQDVTSSIQKLYPRFKKVSIANFGLLRKGNDLFFSVTIDWKAAASGMLEINGPEGTIVGLGKVQRYGGKGAKKKWKIDIEQFGDVSLAQEFDRSMVFGEADSAKLDLLTGAWVEQTLIPGLKRYLHRLEKQNKSGVYKNLP